MPSQTFFDLAYSQFELLTNSLLHEAPKSKNGKNGNDNRVDGYESKIRSIALYLPQENSKTGQLEFLPSAVFPSLPKSERVFIASDANSGLPPTVPPTLTQLPGFQHAKSIIPTYPFTSKSGSTSAVVGTPEEVLCDRRLGPQQTGSATSTALSLPLYSGPQTIGVLLIWGKRSKHNNDDDLLNADEQDMSKSIWSEKDIAQITRVGETLSLALNMDADRHQSRLQTEEFRVAIADNLHQVKNPVQALRTFTKLLQRNMATEGHNNPNINLGRIVDDMVLESDRIARNLMPIDHMIESMNSGDESNHMEILLTSTRPKRKDTENVEPLWTPTTSYLVKLSPTQAQPVKKKTRKVYSSQEDQLQIAFIPDVLKPIFSTHEALAKACGIGFSVTGMENELPGVTIHPKALQEAVANVVDNAIKYVSLGYSGNWGMENTTPQVKISMTPNGESIPRGVTIIVEDNGPGIPSAERNAVFERGFRGVKAKGLTNGSGIGLDYSRSMIEKMGGEIFICSDNDWNGTKVKFILYYRILRR